MRRRPFLALLAAPLLAAAQPRLSEDEVAVDYDDGRYLASLGFKVPVAAAVALAVLTDFERMAAFVPNLSESIVLERQGPRYKVRQSGTAQFGPFRLPFVSERQIEVFPEGRIVAFSLSGSARTRSEMRIQAEGPRACRLDYRLEMVPETWLPAAVGTPFLRHELTEQFLALAGEMLRRAAR